MQRHTSNSNPTALPAWKRGPPNNAKRGMSTKWGTWEMPPLGCRGQEEEDYRHDLLIIPNSFHPRHVPLRLVGGQILRGKIERSNTNLALPGLPFSTIPRTGLYPVKKSRTSKDCFQQPLDFCGALEVPEQGPGVSAHCHLPGPGSPAAA